MKLIEFLQDQTGRFSSMRLMNLSVLFTFLADWIMHMARATQFAPDLSIIGIIIGILGLKQIQNFAEKSKS